MAGRLSWRVAARRAEGGGDLAEEALEAEKALFLERNELPDEQVPEWLSHSAAITLGCANSSRRRRLTAARTMRCSPAKLSRMKFQRSDCP